ncbi:hypothetical protein LTR56_026278 [Elasticomyces elasticus]|nr:hypothetical protein LTR56_026278 [Elasticomyces elasticus]KAK3626759.1 hypothetical protein LTR22_023054 [Elasticomyces elasticus]KAK4922061.1 hypothetical protein LTR49_010647 [Elasticomyces elasticus]KAK5747787.1 hypothetical protein LTS12_022142 [Elasticomyces elasticus]
MKAIVVVKSGHAAVVEKAEPELRPDWVKVKVRAVALNPTDWKHIDFFARGGETVGCDFSGIVTEIGSAVTSNIKVGDAIYGLVHGTKVGCEDTGAFAEYVVVKDGLFAKMPPNQTFEDAATWGAATVTNILGLWQKLGLPTPTQPAKEKFPLLVYGGSSAMGMIAIQLAKLAGLYVVTTASPRNFELLKREYGADAVFDYNDPDCAALIRQETGDKLRHVFDCISNDGSARISAESLAPSATAAGTLQYATLLPVDSFPRSDVEQSFVLGYTAFGESFEFLGQQNPAVPADYAICTKYWPLMTSLIAEGKLKASRFEVREGGLDGIFEGLQILRDGKNSAMKLVYRISE